MATTTAFGDDNANTLDDAIPLYVPVGATVTVQVVDGASVDYYLQGLEQGVSGTITNGSNQNFTTQGVVLASHGRSSITLTGGTY